MTINRIYLLSIFFIVLINTSFAAKQVAPSFPVNVMTAAYKTWQPSIISTGTLVADQGVTIKSDVAGRVTKIYFKSGTHVKAGDPLVQIFPDILQAQLKQDQAAVVLTKQNFERMTILNKKEVASRVDYDQARANYQVAVSNLQKTQAQLEQTLITAPFSGYLGIRKINLGDYLSAGSIVVNLEDTNPMYVDFSIPEVFSKQILKGQKVEISSRIYGKKTFIGTVIAVESLISPGTRTLNVRASIPNKDNVLVPGSFVVTKIFVGEPKQLIQIPQTAIVYSEQGDYVYVIKNNKAVKTIVTLGDRGDKNIFITSGLKAGDNVVTAGQQRLTNGAGVIMQKAS